VNQFGKKKKEGMESLLFLFEELLFESLEERKKREESSRFYSHENSVAKPLAKKKEVSPKPEVNPENGSDTVFLSLLLYLSTGSFTAFNPIRCFRDAVLLPLLPSFFLSSF